MCEKLSQTSALSMYIFEGGKKEKKNLPHLSATKLKYVSPSKTTRITTYGTVSFHKIFLTAGFFFPPQYYLKQATLHHNLSLSQTF